MFTLLENKDEISLAHDNLLKSIKKNFTKKSIRNIGHPGGTLYDSNVYTDGTYWFSAVDYIKATSPRKLNLFGLYKKENSLNITAEVNTPYQGINNSVSGFFAKNSKNDKIYLFHTGRIGGGAKGVGKHAFLAWSNESLTEVIDSKGEFRYGIPVLHINKMESTKSMEKYIDCVVKFKKVVKEGGLNSIEQKNNLNKYLDYYKESTGRRKGNRASNLDYLSRHGDVVDSLRVYLLNKGINKSERFVKNVLIDLGIEKKGELISVYEIKTSCSRTNLYTGIGQLLVHSPHVNCQKTLVVPNEEELSSDVLNALSRLGIKLIQFSLTAKEVIFKT